MPNSPSVTFKIENNNLEQSTPSVGVSCILARTTKGPYNDPSTLITTYTQFKDIYGEEVVPDGSPSNIEKALLGGSKLRVVRVQEDGYKRSYVVASTKKATTTSAPSVIKIEFTPWENGSPDNSSTKTATIVCYIKDPSTWGSKTIQFGKVGDTICYALVDGEGSTVSSYTPIISFNNSGSGDNNGYIDYQQLLQFLTNDPLLEPIIDTERSSLTFSGPRDFGTLVNKMASVEGTNIQISIQTLESNGFLSTPLYDPRTYKASLSCVASDWSNGTATTVSTWEAALDSTRDYSDFDHLACSHIYQHLSYNCIQVHKYAKELADELDDYMYFIEVPKFGGATSEPLPQVASSDNPIAVQSVSQDDLDTSTVDYQTYITWVSAVAGAVGHSRNVAYFGGGLKLYNSLGLLVNADVLGTILGLADTSSSNYGPWRSFAGLNRGLISDGNGPVCPNYGSPSRYNELNKLANAYINMVVVKDTYTAGKQTVLWHCFTSQVKSDSFKFISVVQLVHYLKRLIRPILESKIEEPNYIPTWQDIYLQVKPELDDLVEQEAISEYTWMGDQNATGYSDLQVNKEADVRQGKYKAILKFKEIVPMQDIEMSLVIDKATRTATVEVND